MKIIPDLPEKIIEELRPGAYKNAQYIDKIMPHTINEQLSTIISDLKKIKKHLRII